jgi:hypothetical protein
MAPTPRLVVACREGKSQTLWLVTTEDASTEKGAAFVVQAYTRRWQVEWAFRCGKCELGVASVRVESWAYREKLWRIAELVHAFLLSLLALGVSAARFVSLSPMQPERPGSRRRGG